MAQFPVRQFGEHFVVHVPSHGRERHAFFELASSESDPAGLPAPVTFFRTNRGGWRLPGRRVQPGNVLFVKVRKAATRPRGCPSPGVRPGGFVNRRGAFLRRGVFWELRRNAADLETLRRPLALRWRGGKRRRHVVVQRPEQSHRVDALHGRDGNGRRRQRVRVHRARALGHVGGVLSADAHCVRLSRAWRGVFTLRVSRRHVRRRPGVAHQKRVAEHVGRATRGVRVDRRHRDLGRRVSKLHIPSRDNGGRHGRHFLCLRRDCRRGGVKRGVRAGVAQVFGVEARGVSLGP